MITNFWNWIYSTVNNAVGVLNIIYNNTTMKPFFDLMLVIFSVAVVMKFILAPLIGFGFIGASDKAERELEVREIKREKNTPRNAWYRKVD